MPIATPFSYLLSLLKSYARPSISAFVSTNEFDPHGYPLSGTPNRSREPCLLTRSMYLSATTMTFFLTASATSLPSPFGTSASEIDPSACVSPQVIDVYMPWWLPWSSFQSASTLLKNLDFSTTSLYSGFSVVMESSAAAQ